MRTISHRFDFVYIFDVTNGNPNGDPDAQNLPRLDPETNHGLVSDVCLKRKIRNYVDLLKGGQTGLAIYVSENAILNKQHRKAYQFVRQNDENLSNQKKLNPRSEEEERALQKFMCENFFDVRAFGAVMGTSINCGQVRGPVQLSFARSLDPVIPVEISISRIAATNEKVQRADGEEEGRADNRTMGRKYIIPYGLYVTHGFVSAKFAERTGFSEADIELLWEALLNMFEHDRSATRGEMAARRLVIFEHDCPLGRASSHSLFERVTTKRSLNEKDNSISFRHQYFPPPRRFQDYSVSIEKEGLPKGVRIHELL